MSEPQYQKYGATVSDPSAGMQAGINAQKSNMTDILSSIKGLMTNQEAQYQQENTNNVQNYLKDKLQAGGLNAALTTPEDQDIIKQKFGNMIDMGTVSKTITDQTDILKKKAVELATRNADGFLTTEGGRDPLKAASAFKNTLIGEGATNGFADEQLPGYIAKKATEVQNINTAKLQEHESRVNHVLNAAAEIDPKTKKSGGHDAGMLAIEASILDLPESEKPKAREALRAELEKAGTLTQYQTTVMKDYNDAYAIEGTRRVNDAKNKSIVLKDQLKLVLSNGVQDKYLKAVESSGGLMDAKGNLSQSIVNQLGNIVNNPIEKWAGTFSESGKLRTIRESLGKMVPPGEADAILLQSFQEAYDGGGFFGNDLNQIGFDKINKRVAELTENYKNKVALTKAATAADINVSEVEAKALQDGVTLRKNMFAAGRDEQLSRGRSVIDPLTSESIDTTYAQFKKAMGFGNKTAGETANPKEPTEVAKPTLPFTTAEVSAEAKRIKDLRGSGGTTTVVPASPNPDASATTPNRAAGNKSSKPVNEMRTDDKTEAVINNVITGKSPVRNFLSGVVDFVKDPQKTVSKFVGADNDVKMIEKLRGGASTAEASTNEGDLVRNVTDAKRGIVGGYNIKNYATKEGHVNRVSNIYNATPDVKTDVDVDNYIKRVAPKSDITGKMVMASAKKYDVSPRMILSVMKADSSLGTAGLGQKTNNPGNVGNDDAGNKVIYEALRDGVDAVAINLSKRKVKRNN
jgi:hypothetical protein